MERQRPGYASPVVVTPAGSRQIVTMTNGSIEGLDARPAARSGRSPFPDEWHENIVTPIWTGHASRRLGHAGRHARLHARADRRQVAGNRGVEEPRGRDVHEHARAREWRALWPVERKRGQIVAVDAATGTLKWATEGRATNQAAILLTPNHVLLLTTGGELLLIKPSAARYEEERRYTVADSETWAVPVVLAEGLIVRDATGVMKLTP